MRKNFLIFILLISLLSVVIESPALSQKKHFELNNFPGTFYDIISFSDSSFCSAFLEICKDDVPLGFFLVHNGNSENCFVSDENFVYAKMKSSFYPLVNFCFPFLTVKYNVVPYLYPDFVIKALYILKKLKFNPRISDAMRSNEEQLKYKRRGWSNVESSPHLLGIAMDLSYYTRQDRDAVIKYASSLGIHILEHGGRGNHHIHIQDEEVWSGMKENDVNIISDTLNKYVKINYNILKPYSVKIGNEHLEKDIKFNFYSDKNEIIKIEIENILGQKRAHISAGVFEPGMHTLFIHKDFFKKGTYIIKYFRNNLFFKEDYVYME